jgi:hypothetical protein
MKCLTLLALLIGIAPVRSQTLDWGNEVFGSVVDSNGEALDNTYIFELGAFDEGFTPTESNVGEWIGNWNVFDRATFNAALGYFTSSVQMLPDGTSNSPWLTPGAGSFEGLEAYIFIRNGDQPMPLTEWLLARALDWLFPSADPECCPNGLPTQWAVSDLGSQTPVFGSQGGNVGGGVVASPGPYDLQTHTFIPEPSALFLLAAGGLAAACRRRRD